MMNTAYKMGFPLFDIEVFFNKMVRLGSQYRTLVWLGSKQ